jgi:hypothetical protein
MRRAWRAATAVTLGPEILEFVAEPETRARLVSHARRGLAPVTAVSEELCRRFGDEAVTIPAVKQSIGISVRAVLEEEGYRVIEKGVRLKKDPIFRTGSVYAAIETQPIKTKELLETMLAALSDTEAVQLAMVLEETHEGVLRKALAHRD